MDQGSVSSHLPEIDLDKQTSDSVFPGNPGDETHIGMNASSISVGPTVAKPKLPIGSIRFSWRSSSGD